MPATAARVARNEELFAEANGRIAAVAGTPPSIEHVPFLCECPDAACAEIAELFLDEYGALRLYANRFAISPRCRSGDRALTAIVEQTDRYTIVDRPG